MHRLRYYGLILVAIATMGFGAWAFAGLPQPPVVSMSLDLGTVLNALGFVLVLLGMAVGYGRLSGKVDATSDKVDGASTEVRQVREYLDKHVEYHLIHVSKGNQAPGD